MAKLKLSGSWYFLLTVILVFFILYFIKADYFFSSFDFFSKILVKIIPIFIIVFILMIILNYTISTKKLTKYMGKESGIKAWLIAIFGGIISHGPIYMWYPLLADLKEKGLKYGLIACFLYNRAVKIPILPLMIFYFSLKYVIILTIVMVLMSVIQGIIIDKLMKRR